jgi:hypothetical protein
MNCSILAHFENLKKNPNTATQDRAGTSIDAALGRVTILLTLHRYLESDVTQEVCLRELECYRSAMNEEERLILDTSDDLVLEKLRGRGQLWLESAVTIMWGLGEIDRLPPFDTTCYLYKFPAVQGASRPRSIEELDMARRIASIWTSRSLMWATVKKDLSGPPPRLIPPLRFSGGMDGMIKLTDGYLTVMETFPIYELSADDCSFIAAISVSRLRALNWLLRGNASSAPHWDDPSLNDATEIEREP